MAKQVDCPCGAVVRGEDDDEFVANVEAHVRDKHPEMADTMTREKILEMASEA
jgi:predicted small metal-binding protein